MKQTKLALLSFWILVSIFNILKLTKIKFNRKKDRATRTCGGDLRAYSTSAICTYSVHIVPEIYVRKWGLHVHLAPALYDLAKFS
jgi:hypothetical protein